MDHKQKSFTPPSKARLDEEEFGSQCLQGRLTKTLPSPGEAENDGEYKGSFRELPRIDSPISAHHGRGKRSSRASVCVGSIHRGSGRVESGIRVAPGGQRLSVRNLLVDLDKIEKTAGMTKVRRRNSINMGELHEARMLRLELSRNGIIHASVMHQEWRRKRFQGLYQAMKRRKMLMRLQMQSRVPKEVDDSQGASGLAEVPNRRTHSVPTSSPHILTPKRVYSKRTITLQRTSTHRKQSSEIYVLNSVPPEILLDQVKLACSSQPSTEGYGGEGFVFLTRHGEREDHVNPKWYLNAPNVFDPPLSKRGFTQASELGVRLKSENITHIIASPFTRTVQTAIEVAKHVGVKVHVDYGLAEHMETKQFHVTCNRLQLDPSTFRVKVNTHKELVARYGEIISPSLDLPDLKLSKWPASFPEEEEHLFERTNNTVKHMGMFAFEKKANVLLVSHQTPVEYMAFELCSEAEDKFVSVCCLTKAAPRKKNPKQKGWKLLFQHDDSFLSEPECLGRR
eukprot:CAMPEP_0167827978 /NCGR_PEP_ID=MMETSP0112_2-20121227/11074_1 /TAXON_ID=91324 /ORGANISM="Lotharella globosa, Strain CCCM811" /LENGTH=509 /DNA_ID=CAMNT_0007730961 /DNA_START=139 /DNA_END=1668 /DNA_ORIENTATION=+